MAIKARFYVRSVTKTAGFNGVAVVMLPTMKKSEDNIDWSKYTPSGEFKMNVTDEDAAAEFEAALGKDIAITMEVIEP